MKKRILSLLLILCMAVTFLPTAVFAEDATGTSSAGGTIYVDATNGNDAQEGVGTTAEKAYKTLEKAVIAAKSGDTIQLGEGNYTLYGVSSVGHTKGKDLTFVGRGADKTGWNIGAKVPDPANFGTEYNGDYSFDGAGTVTFKNMTLRSGSADYLGFIRANNTVVENCIINGKTFYWGYTSAAFKNTTFNCPIGDYALWTYSSPTMTFDTCTFNSSGKVINVYTDAGAGKQDITVNFEDCTVTGKSLKPVLNINDSNMGKFKYILNISGNTTVTGVVVDKATCSRLFGFGGKAATNNKGKTVVNFNGTTVWKDGKMVNRAAYHTEGVTVDGVTYDNGVAGANDSLYAEGYKDNAFTITPLGEWTNNGDGTESREVTKTCNYCGYETKDKETQIIPPIDWDVSRSKIATKLDTSTWTSNVTLSLPSAQEKLGSDIVFVIDKSQCGAEAAIAATELARTLLAQQELENAKLKVGIIAFGGTAKVIRPLSEVTSADDLNDSVDKTAAAGLHGSNIQSGLIEADKMLSADTEVSDSRKYVILVSDGHTYEFSKEGEYDKYVDGATEFTGLKTYGIYNETDLYAYAYGISYTIHCLHDQYYTGDYNLDGTRKNGWSGSYLTADAYKTGKPGDSNEVGNVYELPYGTWNAYLEHITEVVKADNGMYDVELHYTTSGYIDYDNQCIKDDNDLTKPGAETKRQKADRILGEDHYIKCGLDENGKDNQLMHASGVDRAVYEAYSKYASMAEKYHCYPIYVKKDYYDSAQTTQDYGYQLMCALGKISNNTGLDVSTPNAPATVPAISNIFSSIKNDILYAVSTGSVVEDKMGSDFDFVPGSLQLTVGKKNLASKTIGNVTYFGDTAESLSETSNRFKVEYHDSDDSFTWTINEPVSNFAPVQLSYKVKLVHFETDPGTYEVPTNEYAKLTPRNSAGEYGEELPFPVPTVKYTVDASGSPAIIAAAYLNTKDHYSYLIGYSDGTVRPNGRITRAEVATIFFRLLTDDTRQRNWSSENNFSDVSADKWYNNAVSTLCHMGVLGGYSDGTFRPNAPITRAEFAKIAVSFAQINGFSEYGYFTDVDSSDWYAPYVDAAKSVGLIEGYSDGSFKPENKITRAEACTIVNRVLGRKPSKNNMKISNRINWPDCTTDDWFYEAIMEATNSHTYQMGKRAETWNDKLPQRDWAALENNWASAYTGKGGEVH